MLSLDKLEALDLVLWLSTTERAALLTGANQSTISRRSRAALERFDLTLQRDWAGWCLDGDTYLLSLERQVHQRARFRGHAPLRLQVPYWTQRTRRRGLPEGWSENPAIDCAVCEDPVRLLRQRVIDACLLTPTQLPAVCSDLVLLDLVQRPIELTLFHQKRTDDPRTAFLRQREQGSLQLKLMPFLPRSCCQRSSDWFSSLVCASASASAGGSGSGSGRGAATASQLTVAFLTPEMRQVQQHPWQVEESIEPYRYVERLAVLADNADEPAVLRLQERLLESVPGC
ncbi:MAG: hypothetical protein VKO65_00600 [Cyanobacteriota bacterium]|nr:hypothetical protein [Cyanobacteriota bacterium]